MRRRSRVDRLRQVSGVYDLKGLAIGVNPREQGMALDRAVVALTHPTERHDDPAAVVRANWWRDAAMHAGIKFQDYRGAASQ